MESRFIICHKIQNSKTDCVWDEIQLVNSKNEHPVAEFELKSILTKLGITDFQSAMSNMSGGQRKRVALALALCTSCDLLLLDEQFKGTSLFFQITSI